MKTITLVALSFSAFLISCGKDTGYVKVKNRTSETLENVSWGNSTDLRNIKPNDSEEETTDKVGEEYIYFSIAGTDYKSKKKIEVDANTGATYIVEDSTDYTVN